MALIVRAETTVMESALAMAGSGFSQGTHDYDFLVKHRGESGSRDDELKLAITSFAFKEHGVGGVVWPAAPLLAQHVLSTEGRCLREPGSRVLELGCGNSALCGIAVAAAFGCEVVATDLPAVLRFARRNVKQNKESIERHGGRVLCRVLEWGKAANNNPRPAPYDMILGADIVYRSELFVPLLETLSAYSAPNTRILLAFQQRHPADEVRLFGELIETFGFYAIDICIESTVHGASSWQLSNMRIVLLRRSSTEDCNESGGEKLPVMILGLLQR